MLINITGIDGCGKTAQIDLLGQYFERNNQRFVLSKAYGHQEKALYSKIIPTLDQVAIMFLFQALHVQQRIKAERELSQGKIVLADRWDDSYYAHHESFGILSDNELLRDDLNKLAFNGLVPNLTFLLDINPVIAIQRTLTRGQSFLDKKPTEYFEKVRNSFLGQASKKNWIVLNANKQIDIIHDEIISSILEKNSKTPVS